jgi:hypothetical protein
MTIAIIMAWSAGVRIQEQVVQMKFIVSSLNVSNL